MAMGAGDVISGILEGVAKGVAATAGRDAKTVVNGGRVESQVITDAEEAEQRAIQAAVAKENAK